jgi:hypothetical protein
MKMSKRDFRKEIAFAFIDFLREQMVDYAEYLVLPEGFEEEFEAEFGDGVNFSNWKVDTAMEIENEVISVLNSHFRQSLYSTTTNG